ncbi:Metalloendoproteinase 2-MMP [Rhynchospora pubera]|uniref:Metalloendoproteinase 2-MMP n=1 Tax=Rhynchospora pubera TaxID=906938 RepID=A0AAV8HF61_9POAL|nr:Metalloendoproteinase 2-MMP [Rhynchospora pubera]
MTTSTILLQCLLLIAVVSLTATALPPIPDPLGKVPNIPSPWLTFKNFSGCHMGENRTGLASMKKYLNAFGYLPSPLSNSNFTDSFDSEFQDAILSYQRHLGLNTTGYLDDKTIEKMVSPRCGVPDIINGTYTHGRHLYTYFQGNPKWPTSIQELKYALIATSASTIDVATLRDVFARAFSRWAAVIPMNFTETTSTVDADITIGFYNGSHGDGEPFDGPLGTLAHAFSPTDGRFHLDASETWIASGDVTKSSSNVAVDLESVAVHEIGHLLGLGHSTVEDAIMYPTLTVRTRKVDLAQDDVSGVQNLYGSNPDFKGVAPAGVAGEMDSNGSGEIIRARMGLGAVVTFLVLTFLY